MELSLVRKAIKVAQNIAINNFITNSVDVSVGECEVEFVLEKKLVYKDEDNGKTYRWVLCFDVDDLAYTKSDMSYPSETIVYIDGVRWKVFVEADGYRDGILPRKGSNQE